MSIINTSKLPEGLALWAERFGFQIRPLDRRKNSAKSRGGASAWSGNPADYLTDEQLDLVRRRERLVYDLHFNSDDPPAIWWSNEVSSRARAA